MKATLVLAATLLVAVSPPLSAQTGAAVSIPPMNCEKPTIPIGNTSVAESNRFQKDVDKYKTCVNDYAKSNQQKAAELGAQAQAYQEAGNKAIDTFNAFAHELNDATKK